MSVAPLIQVAIPDFVHLPPYQAEPQLQYLKQRLDVKHYTGNVLDIHKVSHGSRKVMFGTAITGYIFITPETKIVNGVLRLRINASETAASNRAVFMCKETHRNKWHKGYGELGTITSHISVSCINIGDKEPLAPGYQYAVPFCVEFPDPHCLFCECDIPHNVLPPQSAHMGYALEAILENTDYRAMIPLDVRPNTLRLDLKHYFDGTEACLDRIYSQSISVVKCKRWRKSSPGPPMNITFCSEPVYHDVNYSLTGSAPVNIGYEGPEGGEIKLSSVLYYVFKIHNHAPRGMGKFIFEGPGRFYHEELVSYGEGRVSLDKENLYKFYVSYSLEGEHQHDIIPSYVSCLTSVTYALELIIFANRQTVKLRIPLVLTVGTLPDYSSLDRNN